MLTYKVYCRKLKQHLHAKIYPESIQTTNNYINQPEK